MPKERSHWIMALKTREALPGGPLKELLIQEEASFLLGAVAPDSIYMPVSFHRHGRPLSYFHGEGNLQTLGFWSRAYQKQWLENRSSLAFCYGLTSHLQCDAAFHPAVYSFCGWAGHEDPKTARQAWSKHYRLETLLDLLFQSHYNFPHKKIGLYQLLKQVDVQHLSAVTGTLFFPENPLPPPQMEEFFRKHEYFQRRFSRWDYLMLSWILRLLGISLSGKRDLIYRNPLKKLRILPLQYRHPVTGEIHSMKWTSLVEEAVEKSVDLMLLVDRALSCGNLNLIPPGPHPELGISSKDSEGIHFKYSSLISPGKLF